jgi:hypothetical protein
VLPPEPRSGLALADQTLLRWLRAAGADRRDLTAYLLHGATDRAGRDPAGRLVALAWRRQQMTENTDQAVALRTLRAMLIHADGLGICLNHGENKRLLYVCGERASPS